VMTNQARARPAELSGVVSVAEEWTVARHKESAQEIIYSLPPSLPFVLDAGTGMYLNALVLDIPLAPKVPNEVRAEAERLVAGAENPRREARRLELSLSGAPKRGSIWDGDLRYDATFFYLRPPRHVLDRNISARSSIIVQAGVEEARHLERHLEKSGIVPNPSVREAIGVKEMLLHVSGDLPADLAEEAIAARTRKLARRQIRWFDKLVRTIQSRHPATRVLSLESPNEEKIMHLMHDIIKR
jgi:tRNA dimethylallyltransferase